MDWFIKKIEITNFKYAHDTFRIELGNNKKKNLLLYGENGCGKSTIYWALYTLYQSYFKENADDVKKYFDTNNHQNLLNRYHTLPHSSLIEVEYGNTLGSTKNLKISLNDTNLVRSVDSFVQDTATSSDFMNYKALSSFFDFRNSMATDIFPFFEKELLPLLDLTDKCQHILDDGETVTSYAGEWWSYLLSVPQELPKNQDGWLDKSSEAYSKFIIALNDFNSRLETQLHNLETDTKDILSNIFKVSDVDIKFELKNAEFDLTWPEHPEFSDEKLHSPQILIKAILNRPNIPVEEKKHIAHPKTFFNEAQLTKIALALRLALFEERSNPSIANCNALLCVDDMLISLDMANRMCIIDILMDYSEDYQVIVMTHDKAFYNIFQMEIERKKKASEWLYKQMFIPVNNVPNPIPEPTIVDDNDNLQKAVFHISQYDFAAAGNYLRKECERTLQRLYQKNEILEPFKSDGSRKKLDLSRLIDYLPSFYQLYDLPLGLTPHLNSYRKAILNPMSHADIDTPFFFNELLACKSEIEVLRSMEKTILRENEINNKKLFKVDVHKGMLSQEVEFIFIEEMAKITYNGSDYYRNSEAKLVSMNPSLPGRTVNDIIPVKDIYEAACNAVGLLADERQSINHTIMVVESGDTFD